MLQCYKARNYCNTESSYSMKNYYNELQHAKSSWMQFYTTTCICVYRWMYITFFFFKYINAFPILSYLNSLSFLQIFNQQLMVIVLPCRENNINTKHHYFLFLKKHFNLKKIGYSTCFFSLQRKWWWTCNIF